MGSKVGMLKTCDRCGEQIFLEYTGEAETDGGFTKYSTYDSMEPGWKTVNLNTVPVVSALLCTKCMKELSATMVNFMEEKRCW